MTLITRHGPLLLAVTAALTLTACSGGGKRCDTNPEYLRTEVLPDLIVPEGSNRPPRNPAVKIPQEERLAYGLPDAGSKVCISPPPGLPTLDVKLDRRATLQEPKPEPLSN